MADIATLSVLLRVDDQLSAKLQAAQGKMRAFGQQAGEAGRSLGAIAGPLAAIGGLSVKAFVDFESSFAGIRKTVDATEEQFAMLSAGMRNMAREMPLSVNELNRIGEAAGQLGIKTENILSFTKTMAALGVTTNLSADQAATSLARLANITGLPQGQVDRLGSAIVALGNNMATTEAEIVDFGLRIAGAGEIAGLTEAQILAIGGAMSSVGVQAEAGGTAVQKVLLAMTEQVATGGEQLRTFADVAGMSAAQFSAAFEQDAAGAFTAFVEGLGAAGTDAFAILEALGLEDQRLIRSFLSLAGAGDLLRNSIAMSTQAFAENTALTEEAQKRYTTAASQMAMFKNKLQDVAITIGETLVPNLILLLDKITPIVDRVGDWVEKHPKLTQILIVGAGAVAGLGAALIALGLIMPGITALVGMFGGAVTVATGGLNLLIPLIVGAIAVLGYYAVAARESNDEMANMIKTAEAFWSQLEEGERTTQGYLTQMEAIQSVQERFPGLAEEMKVALWNELTPAFDATTDEMEEMLGGLKGIDPAIRAAAEAMAKGSDEAARMAASYEELTRVLWDTSDSLDALYKEFAPEIGEGLMTQADLLAILADRWNAVAQSASETHQTIEELMGEEVMALAARLAEEGKLRAAAAEEQNRIADVLHARAKERAAEEEERIRAQALRTVDWQARVREAEFEGQNPNIKAAVAAGQLLGRDPLELAGYAYAIADVGVSAFAVALQDIKRLMPSLDWQQYVNLALQVASRRKKAQIASLGIGADVLAGLGISAMATGGIVRTPTLALVGERGPEAIVPLGGRGTGIGVGITINYTQNGPVFGMQDFEDEVARAWRDVARAGGFRDVL